MGTDNTDKLAFFSIMGLAALTGVITYFLFTAATPKEGIVDSIYRQDLPPATTEASATDAAAPTEVVDESAFANTVQVQILEGSATQGNPAYDPDPATATADALITWVNEDTVPHTATSGTGPQDPESGTLFDSSILMPSGKFSIPAEEIGQGEHDYYCTVHPFMLGKLTIT